MNHTKLEAEFPAKMNSDAAEVYKLLKGRRNSLLMLDYDGTLAPFCVDRSKAFPYPGVRECLESILENPKSRLVIISGRVISDLIPLLGLDPLPEIWGSHGWERRFPNGEYTVGPFDEEALRGIAEADDWAYVHGLETRCERKPGSVALHWRGLHRETAKEMLIKAITGWRPLEEKYGLQIQAFSGGVEIRIPGRNKGDVVRRLLSESPPDTAAAYLGDDKTDEDAFEALAEKGLSALVRPVTRASRADVWIRPPEELIRFLEVWAGS
jgi:trehalose-phosphatase